MMPITCVNEHPKSVLFSRVVTMMVSRATSLESTFHLRLFPLLHLLLDLHQAPMSWFNRTPCTV